MGRVIVGRVIVGRVNGNLMNILYDVIMYVSKQQFQLIKKGQITTKKGCNSIFYSQIHEISLLIFI